MAIRFAALLSAVATVSVLTLAGCASTGAGAAPDDGRIDVVASTDVYGQIVEQLGGDHVSVESIITSASQDPHEFEATASDQLAVKRAQLIIQNGAGYDAFMDSLVSGSGSTAPLITAAKFSPEWPGEAHLEGFNEHVWYDPKTIADVATAVAEQLTKLAPDAAPDIAKNLDAFQTQLATLQSDLAALAAAHSGVKVFATEPVPMYLAEAAGMVSITPTDFSEAVEEGQDVPPAVLHDSLDLIASGAVTAVLANAQTGGPETEQVISAAKSRGIPVAEFTETLPEGKTYIQWMTDNVSRLADILNG